MFPLLAVAVSLLLFHFSVAAFQITGAPVAANESLQDLPQRREINDFARAGAEFDLYILALQRFQLRDQSDPLSYFQVAGIHGYPRQGWDGVGGTGRYPGFCTHAAVIFPTWHRAYLALFEQIISDHAHDIAELYPPEQRDQYRAAARTVRLPYWDWAVNPALPPTTVEPTITINTPEGFHPIRNPLYGYIFHPGPEGNGFPANHPLSGLSATTRYYNVTTSQRNDSAATAVLRANAANTLTMTYQLLSSVSNYTIMSCTFPGGVPNRVISLEAVHNNIHNFVGGFYGHMTWPELSAFDPIFWLHHSNVDRLFAIWQALNPDTYIVPTVNGYGSFAELPGSIDTGGSGLAPFHADNGSTLFTSDGVRNTANLGYTYPELASRNVSASERMNYVRAQVNGLYAPTSKSVRRSIGNKLVRGIHNFPRVSLKQAKQLEVNNAAIQWSIIIEVPRANYNTSYSLDFFLGQAPAMAQRSTARNLIGTYGQFVVHKACEAEIGMVPSGLLMGEVSLTHMLSAAVSLGIIDDLTPSSVVPVLQEHLNWTARTRYDQNIDLNLLDGLSVAVYSRMIEPRTANCEFPVYGAATMHIQATENKAGGVRVADLNT